MNRAINDLQLVNAKRPLVAGLYARVSTGRQEQEETIDSQIEEIKLRIESDGNLLSPENIYIDDGWTGEMLQRPGLDVMRDAAMAGAFQILYVYDRGRLSRVFAYQEIIIEELLDKDIQFVTLHDVQAQTAEERVLQAMQGVFHEYERVKIAERMRRGKHYKAKAGIIINGDALYGYRYIRKTETEPARYEINEDEARVVRMIFQWVGVEGISLREVIKRLYEMKITPRKKKRDIWTKGPLVRILQNDTYVTGIAYYNKTEAVVAKKPIKHEKYKKIKRNSRRVRPKEEWIPFKIQPIIEDAWLFEKVQQVLERNKKYANKKRKRDYLLTGVIYCECGSPRVGDGSNKNGHYYYRCSDRIKKFPLRSECTSQGVNAQILDGMLWIKLKERLMDSKLLRKGIEEYLRLQKNSIEDQEYSRLTTLMEKINEEEKRYAKAYATGSLQFENYQELVKDVQKRRLSIAQQLQIIKKRQLENTIDISSDELYNEAKSVVQKIDFSDKHAVVKDVVDKVTIKERSGIEVWAHIPLSTLPIQKLGYEPIGRYCWSSECWEIHTF